MKNKHVNKTRILVVQVVTAGLVGVSLFLQYTSKTHEDIVSVRTELRQEIGAVRTEMKQDIGDLRQLLTENLLVLTQEMGELKGRRHTSDPREG